MMIYESVETGSSSCYRNRQGSDIKIKKWAGQVQMDADVYLQLYCPTFTSKVSSTLYVSNETEIWQIIVIVQTITFLQIPHKYWEPVCACVSLLKGPFKWIHDHTQKSSSCTKLVPVEGVSFCQQSVSYGHAQSKMSPAWNYYILLWGDLIGSRCEVMEAIWMGYGIISNGFHDVSGSQPLHCL